MTPKEKTWVILCELNNAFISKDDWQNSTQYAKKELKRKALYICDIVMQELTECNAHKTFTDYWTMVSKELESL